MKEGTEQMVERHISEAVNDRTLGELALFASSVEEKKEPCILIKSAKEYSIQAYGYGWR